MSEHSATAQDRTESRSMSLGLSQVKKTFNCEQLNKNIHDTCATTTTQSMPLKTGSLYKQWHLSTSIGATWWRRIKILHINGVIGREWERQTWLRLFIAHQGKQRPISESNHKTHLKISVGTIRANDIRAQCNGSQQVDRELVNLWWARSGWNIWQNLNASRLTSDWITVT